MGAFFSNVQAQIPGPIGDAEARVIAAVTALVRPLRPCEPGERADREVVVLVEQGWVSLYDEGTESQDHELIDRLATTVGAALGGPAFGVLVHDSDVLKLHLVHDGSVHRFDSNPGYFAEHVGKHPAASQVASTWAAAFPSTSLAKLLPAFAPSQVFAETALPVLGGALGLDPERLSVGHNYLADSPGLRARATVLRFHSDERPPWERTLTGPPRLVSELRQSLEIEGVEIDELPIRPTLVAEGGPIQISFTTVSAGRATTGIEVSLRGGPDVAWERVQLLLGHSRQGGELIELALVEQDGQWSATFESAAVPAGVVALGLQELQQAEEAGANLQHAMDARLRARVHINVHGTGGAASVGKVQVSLRPIEGEGTTAMMPVQVVSTASRPLRAPASVHPLTLAPLDARDNLVALVTLDELGTATAVLRALAPHLPDTPHLRIVRYPAPAGGMLGFLKGLMGGNKLETTHEDPAGFFESSRFDELLAEVPTATALVTAEGVDDPETLASVYSVRLGTSMLPLTPDLLPTLVVSVRVDAIDADAAQLALQHAIDASTRSGGVVQALLTRWGTYPTADDSPYEAAVGVRSAELGSRKGRERWLRAIGEGSVWLGEALRSHVPQVTGTELDGALRIDVNDVAETERALARVLPSPTDHSP